MKTQPQELTTEELKKGLMEGRARVLKDIHALEEELRALVDVKAWLQREPWFWIAGAAGAGFLLGVLSGGRQRNF